MEMPSPWLNLSQKQKKKNDIANIDLLIVNGHLVSICCVYVHLFST